MMSRRVRSRRFRPHLKSLAPLALAGLVAYHTPAPAEGAREGPVDQFVIGERPFVASSSWNTPIAEGAFYQKVGWPISARFGVAWSGYSPAIYAASNSDPLVSVQCPPGWGYPGGTVNVRMPPDADGAVGTDGELLVIDGNAVHNLWQFKRLKLTEATARSYGATNVIRGNGWGRASPFLGAGIVGAGSSQLAGMLIQEETDRGEIPHALQLSIEISLAKPGHIGEAISGAPTVAMPQGLSPLGQKIFRAYQKYGAFVIDVAGGVTNLRA
jgi:hypothetical protein